MAAGLAISVAVSPAAFAQSTDGAERIDRTARLDRVPPPPRTEFCTLALQPAGVVVEVIDAVTLRLSDGQVVRLAGVIAPTPPRAVASLAANASSGPWRPEANAKTALTALVANNAAIEIAVADLKARTDRYGRTIAHVMSTRDGNATWLQGALLNSGHARVTSIAGGSVCINEMLTLEAEARHDSRGLWANAAYRAIDANDTRALDRQRSAFAIVEGTVASVAQRSTRTYINFGRDWKWDFTATVPKSVIKNSTGAVNKLASLSGRRVRVRGWIERRNGPMIEVTDLDEIEDLTAPQVPAPLK